MAELIKGKILVSHALRNDFNVSFPSVGLHNCTNYLNWEYDFRVSNPPERTQTLPSGVGQGSSEVEVDKNQRYQSTLQFAASLLLQIQQQQQQQQVIRVHEEFFLPGEIILEQGNVVDQLYFICHGLLEEVGIGQDGSEQTISLLEPNNTFGQISIFCNVPHPSIVGVLELFRLLRNDRESLSNIIDIYFYDGKKI
ncbi:potassium channel SKOR-like isoform X4 [Spinacia oleracea]|uniref:Potassium channel n=1 Tax=Spinacia oleracea TaxID=3562 RepID=A0ABM3RJU1_SPIOL|nr:potassium channel SKOR-like isoform X4 [Spinacia oleracea]